MTADAKIAELEARVTRLEGVIKGVANVLLRVVEVLNPELVDEAMSIMHVKVKP